MKSFIGLFILLSLIAQAAAVEYKYSLFTKECFEEFFTKHNFINMACLTQTASRGISLIIVVLSLMLKIPQILKITSKKTVHGLSFDSLFYEGILLSFTIAYNVRKGNQFMLYGENVFILIQNFIISFLFKLFDKQFSMKNYLIKIGLFILINAPLYTPLVPDVVFDLAIYVNMGLLLFARIPQIVINFKNKSTGQLALLTTFLSFAGSCARGFTIIVSAGDLLLTLQNIEAITLNGILIAQFIVYRNSDKVQPKSTKQD